MKTHLLLTRKASVCFLNNQNVNISSKVRVEHEEPGALSGAKQSEMEKSIAPSSQIRAHGVIQQAVLLISFCVFTMLSIHFKNYNRTKRGTLEH